MVGFKDDSEKQNDEEVEKECENKWWTGDHEEVEEKVVSEEEK